MCLTEFAFGTCVHPPFFSLSSLCLSCSPSSTSTHFPSDSLYCIIETTIFFFLAPVLGCAQKYSGVCVCVRACIHFTSCLCVLFLKKKKKASAWFYTLQRLSEYFNTSKQYAKVNTKRIKYSYEYYSHNPNAFDLFQTKVYFKDAYKTSVLDNLNRLFVRWENFLLSSSHLKVNWLCDFKKRF